MKTTIIAFSALLLSATAWFCWTFRPFMNSGHTICIGTWKINNYTLQIWQRKKATIEEPFSTSLYVQKGTNDWRQYYLNHQDTYRPEYKVSESNEVIYVSRDMQLLGVVRLSTGEYVRSGSGVSLEAVLTHEPP